MNKPVSKTRILLKCLAVFLLGVVLVPSFRKGESVAPDVIEVPDTLTCYIAIDSADMVKPDLLTGYLYELSSKFMKDNNMVPVIRLGTEDDSPADSLDSLPVGMLVIPMGYECEIPEDCYVMREDSLFSIVFKGHDLSWLAESWLHSYKESLEYGEDWCRFAPFSQKMSAIRAAERKCISPYDSIFKEKAGEAGLDWRLLAAISYHESRFMIQARSRYGATGLMQIMPAYFRGEDIFNPEENISAAVGTLQRIEDRMSPRVPDPAQLQKFILASYNAGPGRILDCMAYTTHKGKDASVWENVASVIPEMEDAKNLEGVDGVSLGAFKCGETVAFIRQIQNTYSIFCAQFPKRN